MTVTIVHAVCTGTVSLVQFAVKMSQHKQISMSVVAREVYLNTALAN